MGDGTAAAGLYGMLSRGGDNAGGNYLFVYLSMTIPPPAASGRHCARRLLFWTCSSVHVAPPRGARLGWSVDRHEPVDHRGPYGSPRTRASATLGPRASIHGGRAHCQDYSLPQGYSTMSAEAAVCSWSTETSRRGKSTRQVSFPICGGGLITFFPSLAPTGSGGSNVVPGHRGIAAAPLATLAMQRATGDGQRDPRDAPRLDGRLRGCRRPAGIARYGGDHGASTTARCRRVPAHVSPGEARTRGGAICRCPTAQ